MIDGMPEPQRALPARRWESTVAAAWATIICLGGTQVWFNVASALRHSALSPVPVLAGLAPVLGSVLLSHLAASRRASPLFRALVTVIMLAAMAVSIGATIEVATPVLAHAWRAVLLGIVLDSASLAALWFIMDRHREKADAASAADQAQAAASDATARAAAAGEQAREAIAQAAARADEAAADAAEARAGRDAASAELTAVRAELQGLRSGLNKRRGSGRKPARGSASGAGASSALNKGAGSAVPDDVDTQAEALRILGEDPDISGRELGIRLGGLSESYGCRLKRELAKSAPGPDTP
jgi:hypothetical protein